ncbi:lytic transglycosylase [Afifella sp. IM 167]|nr:lytic transglycosylase [Afifella sp. IM 167]
MAETNNASKAVIVARGQEAAAEAKNEKNPTERTEKPETASIAAAAPSSNSKAVIIARARASSPAEDKKDSGKSNANARKTGKSNLHDLVVKVAAAHGVPAGLAHAVVTIESRYNPRARGSAGEVGLMQIKPATARGIGYTGSIAALYDPATNLEWGMRYLAKAYKLGGGSVCGTALRYNAGHFAKRMTRGASAYCGRLKAVMASAGTEV